MSAKSADLIPSGASDTRATILQQGHFLRKKLGALGRVFVLWFDWPVGELLAMRWMKAADSCLVLASSKAIKRNAKAIEN